MTLSVTADTVIARPIEEVFAFLADFHNDPLWTPQIAYIEQITPGSIGLGTAYWQMQAGSGQAIADGVITVFEQHRRIATRITTLSLEIDGIYDFAAVAGGTRVAITAIFYPRGFMRLFLPFLRRSQQREAKAALDRLALYLMQ